jgi:GNAT superfamily N-acetyltransferase
MIEIKEVKSKKDIKDFVNFQYELYKNHKYWVPPIKSDEIKALDPGVNPAFDFCDARFWTAWDGRKCVGRIGAIVNHTYNEKIGKKMGRISRAEFIDDKNVSKKLFEVAEKWLKREGMEAVHGPLGFTNFDNQGLLIEGFDYLPSIASVMHFPYYKEHFETLGYDKEIDWVEFRLKMGQEIPEKATRLAKIIKERNNLEILRFTTKQQLRGIMKEVFGLLNEAFAELPYVAPFSDKLINYFAEKYFKVLNPEYVVVIKKEGQVVAFILGMPSLSEAMQKAKGKLFPFGFIHILRAMKNPEVMDLLLTGVHPDYQKLGLPAILINELQSVIMKHHIKYVETTGMFETNTKGITHWKSYDHIQHKRRRCFVKPL